MLLAALAGAGEAGLRRDQLLLLLWPESELRKARNTLNQELYVLRRELRCDELFLGSNPLQLDPRVVSSDLAQFRAAIAAADHHRAIDLYTGPFLDGLSAAGLPEFERWAARVREETARQCVDALTSVARAAERDGRPGDAAALWRRCLDVDPTAVEPARSLIKALDASGRRFDAIQFAQAHLDRLRDEFDIEPDEGISSLAATLTRFSPDDSENDRPAEPAADPTSPPPSPPSRRRRWRAPAGLLLSALAVAIVGAVFFGIARDRREEPASFAVLPFAVQAAPAYRALGPGMVGLLTASLDGVDELVARDPAMIHARVPQGASLGPQRAVAAARQLRAQSYVQGEIIVIGGQIQIRAQWVEVDDSRVRSQAAVAGDTTAFFSLVDELAKRLLAGRYSGRGVRLIETASSSTESFSAFRHYLDGELAMQRDRYVDALAAYQEAIAIDSAFALAHYRSSRAADWLGRDSVAQAGARSAVRFAARLPDRERQLLEGWLAWRIGDLPRAEEVHRAAVVDYPDDPEAWFALGEVLFHGNPLRGRSATEAKRAFERTVALDSSDLEALMHLARVEALEGNRASADRLAQRLRERSADREILELRAFRAFALSDPESQRRATRQLFEQRAAIPDTSALETAIYWDDVEGMEALGRLLSAPNFSADVRGMGYRVVARTAVARGRWGDSREALREADRFDPVAALELRSLMLALPFLPADTVALREARSALEQWDAGDGPQGHTNAHRGHHDLVRLFRLALLDVRLGDTTQAARRVAMLEQIGANRPAAAESFANTVRAQLAFASGRPEQAMAALERTRWHELRNGYEGEALARFSRGSALALLGRDAEAIQWLDGMSQRASYELPYLAPSHLALGRIRERGGDRSAARRHFAEFVRLWKDSDVGSADVAWAAGRL